MQELRGLAETTKQGTVEATVFLSPRNHFLQKQSLLF